MNLTFRRLTNLSWHPHCLIKCPHTVHAIYKPFISPKVLFSSVPIQHYHQINLSDCTADHKPTNSTQQDPYGNSTNDEALRFQTVLKLHSYKPLEEVEQCLTQCSMSLSKDLVLNVLRRAVSTAASSLRLFARLLFIGYHQHSWIDEGSDLETWLSVSCLRFFLQFWIRLLIHCLSLMKRLGCISMTCSRMLSVCGLSGTTRPAWYKEKGYPKNSLDGVELFMLVDYSQAVLQNMFHLLKPEIRIDMGELDEDSDGFIQPHEMESYIGGLIRNLAQLRDIPTAFVLMYCHITAHK